MELVLAAVVVGLLICFGVALQAGLLVFATGWVADEPASFPQALGAVVGANVASVVIQLSMELVATGGSMLFSLPASLVIWGVVISFICDMRLSQAVFSAILMSIFQCVFGVGVGLTAMSMMAGWASSGMYTP